MNFCRDGGYLVDGTHALPVDPTEFHVAGLPVIGCNDIRCSQCQALVRNAVGLAFLKPNEKADLRSLYEVADLTTSPLLHPQSDVRLYLCKCNRFLETRYRALEDPDNDNFQSPNVPWSCQGHPPVTLPHDFEGTRVDSEAGLAELVKASLRGRPPDTTRLYQHLAQTPYQETVARAAVAALDDPDPAVRARALQFFYALDLPIGAQRALALLDGDRRGFAGVPDPVTRVRGDRTLEDGLWRVVAPLVQAAGRARDLARAEALSPGKGRPALYAALAGGDPEWVAAHAEEILGATPSAGNDLIDMIRARFPRNVPSKPLVEKLRALVKKP